MERRPTIYDVAREAGVAPSTVSRAYARPGRVNSDTAKAIFEVAERLGYRSTALGGATGAERVATGSIALVIADVTNPFYAEIINGAYSAAHQAGYNLILSHTGESPTLERNAIEHEFAHVDGVVIASSRMSDSSLRMMAKQKAIVLLNRTIPEVNCVVSDNPRGVRRAAEHLGMLGHDTVTYVAGPETSWVDGIRWRSLREAALELELKLKRIGPNQPNVQAGLRAARQVVESHATAVLAYNDQLAIGVIKGIQALGLRVPQDISVVGFDNIILDEIVSPALTTVAAPLRAMGANGVTNCIAVAGGARTKGQPLLLPVKLIERESTAHRSAAGGGQRSR
ncbi:LacI family DNA-binding transcriptional regulator [Nakamurella lactea]|uniref:LacI family DNA-binding transcriptional regulator n=1 Tax=Nakamurella lactea TaxID=459515 RepID=UPI00040C30BC|nr:LacI family DNA-binding transcriptional regulator [Nakamurella lactea]